MRTTKFYLKNSLRTLLPAHDEVPGPYKLLRMINAKQWQFFLLGLSAWTWDAFDFHSVTLSYPDLTESFNRPLDDLTLAVTLTLMTRPIGGIIFGILSDRYGRKWPFIANCILLIAFVLGTGFCRTFGEFLTVRALFGIAMGGIYGNAAATALEDCPKEARGLLSGVYQGGFPLGFVLASCFYKAFHNTKHGWRSLFWFGSAVPVLLIVFRLCLPETNAWKARRQFRSQHTGIRGFNAEIKLVLQRHWLILLYLVFLLMGMVYMTHSTMDIYPWLLRFKYRELDTNAAISKATAVQTIGNLGGVLGGATVGYTSQIVGRRFSIIVMSILGAALLYPYAFTNGNGIYVAAFFEQFCVEGAWSVIPIHLIELSPAAFRTLVVGTSYQTGVLLASGSNNILTKIAKHYPVPLADQNGSLISKYNFAIPICAFSGAVFAYVIIIAAIGPEKRGNGMAEEDSDDSDAEFGVIGTRPHRVVRKM